MNARIELLASPTQSNELPATPVSCCGTHSRPSDESRWIAALLVAGIERSLELIVRFATWSRHGLFPRNGAAADTIILK